MRSVCRSLVVTLAVIAAAVPVPALAHGAIHEQIQEVTARIRREPKNASLYLKRGELHRVHEEWKSALADYDRAARLQPDLALVRLARGKALASAGRPADAKRELDRFLKNRPDHPDGLVTRAGVQAKLGAHAAAAADYARAITLLPEPGPEHYLARARSQAALGGPHVDAALRGLDEGISRLGPIVSLQTYAMELELKQQRWDAALARLDTLSARAGRKEPWLVRRGEILQLAGRRGPAEDAYRAGLAAIEALPPARRAAPATAELEKRVREHLARLAASGPTGR